MKTRLLICAVLLFVTAGCATDNTQKLTQAHDLYNGTETAIVSAYNAKTITPAEIEKIKPCDAAARAALKAMDATVANDPTGFATAMEQFNSAIAVLTAAKDGHGN